MGILDKLKELVTGKRDPELPDFSHNSMAAEEIYKQRQGQKLSEALYNKIAEVRAKPPKPSREQRREQRQQNILNRNARLQLIKQKQQDWATKEMLRKTKKQLQTERIKQSPRL